MMKRIVCLLCVLMLAVGMLGTECAAATVDLEQECSLTVSYLRNGTGFADLEIEIFRVAELSADGESSLLPPYDSYPIKIHGITSQQEWQETAQTIKSYVTANQIPPTQSRKTDEDGNAVFTGLETGLYMVKGTTARVDDRVVIFQDFMIYLPTPVDGEYVYDMEAVPKFTEYVEPEKYTVIKLWKDSGSAKKRPKSITVDILKDGVVQQTVTLSAANDWTYTWEVLEKGSTWTVVERDVPDGYRVTIANNQTTFIITNTKKTETPDTPTPDSPKTGDTMPLLRYMIIMCVSGLALIIIGILRLKDKKNEKK